MTRFMTAFILTLSFARGGGATQDDTLSWHDDHGEALAEARDTGQPLLVEFRCAP